MKKLTLIILALSFMQVANASSSGHSKKKMRDKMPSKQAMTACESINENDACSFESRKGHKVMGTCHNGNKGLVCRPNHKKSMKGGM